MTNIAQEQSIESGSPLELYDIVLGVTHWRYTSSDTNYIEQITGNVYKALPINRPNLIYSADYGKTSLDLEFDKSALFLEVFRVSAPSGVVSVTIKRVQRNDSAHEVIVVWKGRILNIEWTQSVAKATCESIRSSVQRFGLRRCFQLQCPHVLYSTACGATKALFEVLSEVSVITNNIIHVAGAVGTVGKFAGGYAQWTNAETLATERRMISTDDGSGNLTLVGKPLGLVIGIEIRVYPGCDHTLDTCEAKFANSANYGGFPYTPPKNPFSGDPVY